MVNVLTNLNIESAVIGIGALIVIGTFHPIVIKCEYYFSDKVWPVFLLAGAAFMIGALLTDGIISILLALIGAGALWSIKELKEQKKRVEKGWFPKNPNRK